MGFAFPWLWGLPLAFLRARGARCGGYCLSVVVSDGSRSRCVRARLARAFVGSLLRRRSPLFGEKGFFSGTDARGCVLPSGVGDREVWGRMVAFWGPKFQGKFFF